MVDHTIEDRWFLLTNRRNLIGMCTQRLVCPRWGLEKYYLDLLEVAPGYLPLIAGGVSSSLVDLVFSESGSSYPVMVEVAASPDFGRLRTTERGVRLLLLDGGLDLSSVESVHFRSDVELSEFLAREYDNFDPTRLNVAVSPELFETDGLTADELSTLCSTLEPVALLPGVVREVDGALGGVSVILTRDPVAADSLPETFERTRKAISSLVDGDEPIAAVLNESVTPILLGPNPTASDADLMETIIGILLEEVGTLDISPTAIVESILEDMSSSPMDTESTDVIFASLRKVQAVLLGQQPLTPFKRGVGLETAKGLLLFLLRPNTREVMSWTKEEVGPDETPILIASFLSGLVHGYQRRPLGQRGEAGLDELLGRVRCDALNRRVSSKLPRASSSEISFTAQAPTETSDRIAILANDVELALPRLTKRDLVAEVIDNPKVPTDVEPLIIEVLRKIKWDDAVVTIITGQKGEIGVLGRRVQVSLRGKTEIAYTVDREVLLEFLVEGEAIFKAAADGVLERQQRDLLRSPPKKRPSRSRKKVATRQNPSLELGGS